VTDQHRGAGLIGDDVQDDLRDAWTARESVIAREDQHQASHIPRSAVVVGHHVTEAVVERIELWP
jgi:hypothetical protein